MDGGAWRVASEVTLWVCWGLFGLVWSAGAVYNAWKGPRTRSRSMGRAGWIVFGVGVWLLVRHFPGAGRGAGNVDEWWVRAIGIAILVAMTAFALWARGALGTMWSSITAVKEGHQLRTDGPYAIVRHPIYTGILGMLLGTAVIGGLGRWLVLVVVGVVVFEAKLHSEERLLSRTFGEEYDRYRRRVPQLVPGLRLGRR
jgi:protein-S-isoprenylcysteine O-methyltransferase Ste14